MFLLVVLLCWLMHRMTNGLIAIYITVVVFCTAAVVHSREGFKTCLKEHTEEYCMVQYRP